MCSLDFPILMRNNAYELAAQLKGLGFGDNWQLPLAFRMQAGVQTFQLRIAERSPSDQVWYYLHFVRGSGTDNFLFSRYDALLRKQVPVPEGNLDGIDTSSLDRQMAAVDWSLNYSLFGDRHVAADARLLDKYEAYLRVAVLLVKLAASEKGSQVATALALNHFAEHPPSLVFSGFEREKRKWELHNTFYVHDQETLTKGEARNILYGRAVWKSYHNDNGELSRGWFQLAKENTLQGGEANSFFFDGGVQFPSYDLERSIRMLPLVAGSASARMRLLEQLHPGDLVAATLRGSPNRETVFVAANPETRSLDLYNPQGRKQSLENFLTSSISATKRRRSI